ncbi:MAG: tetratricopeptide repeat protein [Pyrinomonadaceae bacterium]|nr:tetratricopeptide repeat protein [Pyrinomonadaceae bacterium]
MATRKKRTVAQQFQAPAPDTKPKTVYQDEFQSNVSQKVENFGRQFDGKGKTILYGIAALAVLAVLIGIFTAWNRRSNAEAQTALGRAIETSQAQVTESPDPTNLSAKTFSTEKARSEAAVAEFQAVADKYDNPVKEKAQYFAAVNRLKLDRNAGILALTDLAKSSGEVGTLSKFALAQANAGDGKFDEAAALYQELAALANPILSKDSINFELAQIYQKQGKTTEAADLYYNIAKAASEAKDAEDKPVPMSQTAREAKDKLEQINPERAKEIVEPETPPLGGMPLGM